MLAFISATQSGKITAGESKGRKDQVDTRPPIAPRLTFVATRLSRARGSAGRKDVNIDHILATALVVSDNVLIPAQAFERAAKLKAPAIQNHAHI